VPPAPWATALTGYEHDAFCHFSEAILRLLLTTTAFPLWCLTGQIEKKVNAMSAFPRMFRLKQSFQRPVIGDIPETTRKELDRLGLGDKICRGQKIGITVGSRGIQNLGTILKETVHYVRGLGGAPQLIAAMGSHGGGKEQGQKEVLDSLGITEAILGAPVVTCAECQTVAHTSEGLPVFIIEAALGLDGILVVNRVKPHTSFRGKVESGLIKELVVGLGGPKGAQQFHGFGPAQLPQLLIDIGRVILEKLPIMGGLAIVENAYEETALVRAVPREEMIERESELLVYSRSLMPSLPVEEIDFLIIQEMGKNFSGTGMDTNIIGRARIHGVPEPERPSIKRIAVLDLSAESHGNATGVGMADFVTRRLVDKMDRQATYLNCLTSTFVVRAAIPMYFDSEKQLVDAAHYSLCSIPAADLSLVIIPNTLFLTECLVSEAIAKRMSGKPGVELGATPEEFSFDNEGNLVLRV
jgi:hypothetical protein